MIEEWISAHDHLVILNNGQPTHFSTASGKESIIDLTIATSNIAPNIEWNALQDLHDSDHYPISIQVLDQHTHQPIPRPP